MMEHTIIMYVCTYLLKGRGGKNKKVSI